MAQLYSRMPTQREVWHYWRQPNGKRKLQLAFLLATNALTLFGVLVLGWQARQVVLLYFIESILIGIFNLPRILASTTPKTAPQRPGVYKGDTSLAARIALAVFFMFHYGLFMGVQSGIMSSMLDVSLDMLNAPDLQVTVLLLIGLQTYDFIAFYRQRPTKRADPSLQMFRPYGRVFVQQFVVIFGAWISLGLPQGGQIGFLILLVVCRVIAELVLAVQLNQTTVVAQR